MCSEGYAKLINYEICAKDTFPLYLWEVITATKLMETRDQLNLVDVSVMVYASRLSFWVVKKTECGLSNSFPLEAENKKCLRRETNRIL